MRRHETKIDYVDIIYYWSKSMVNAIIFTEESGVKFPPIYKWKARIGNANDVEKSQEILSLLKANSLEFPHKNLELELTYKGILHKYIRPANFMFAGSFNEVRYFPNYLPENTSSEIMILSSRYGLLRENDEIIPYANSIKQIKDLELLDTKTNFTHEMLLNTYNSDVIMVFLPKIFVKYLLKKEWFDRVEKNKTIIIVSAKQLKEDFSGYKNVVFLERKGVGRIGIKNRDTIIQFLKNSLLSL